MQCNALRPCIISDSETLWYRRTLKLFRNCSRKIYPVRVQQNKICPNRTIFDRLAAVQICPKSQNQHFFCKNVLLNFLSQLNMNMIANGHLLYLGMLFNQKPGIQFTYIFGVIFTAFWGSSMNFSR